MSDHKKPQSPELRKALQDHRLAVDTPSQLSDSFRHGWLARERAAADEVARLREALGKYEAVWHDMFGHFCSNGLFNAWGKEFPCGNLNEAHRLAEEVLK